MKLYVIEDLTREDIQAIAARLQELELGAGMEGLFWLPLPTDLLHDVQKEHAKECGPHCMALEILENSIKIELLVRARNKLRCDCVCYASTALKAHVIEYMDSMLSDLGIYV